MRETHCLHAGFVEQHLPRCKMRRHDDKSGNINQFKFIRVYMHQYTSSELSPCGVIMLR